MRYKSQRAKACDIPKSVKERVYERDQGRCVLCHKQGVPNAHYLPRSRGGLGIEQNIVTLCPRCHYEYDNGAYRKEYGELIKEYLSSIYDGWNEQDLIYKKRGTR